MAGRAGRPQFDNEGIAITLAPEEVVQQIRKETAEAQKKRQTVDHAKLRRAVYAHARTQAAKTGNASWDPDLHQKLVQGQPAPLRSHTKIGADQILAIGLPDLQTPEEPWYKNLPPSMNLHIQTVVEHLLMDDRSRDAAKKQLKQLTENLMALGIVDQHGNHVNGKMIRDLRGMDGPFVYFCLREAELDYFQMRELVEFLTDHDVIHKRIQRQSDEKKREWVKNRLRDLRRERGMVTWEEVEEEYDSKYPRQLSFVEKINQQFLQKVPHPELHGGKVQKNIWATMEDQQLSFMDFVESHQLQNEEGNLFSYLTRAMKMAEVLHDATHLGDFYLIERSIRRILGSIDERVLEDANASAT